MTWKSLGPLFATDQRDRLRCHRSAATFQPPDLAVTDSDDCSGSSHLAPRSLLCLA